MKATKHRFNINLSNQRIQANSLQSVCVVEGLELILASTRQCLANAMYASRIRLPTSRGRINIAKVTSGAVNANSSNVYTELQTKDNLVCVENAIMLWNLERIYMNHLHQS